MTRSLLSRLRPSVHPPCSSAAPRSALADLLAPDAITLARDQVQFDGVYTRTLALTAFPRRVSWGWLSRITTLREPLLLSLHLEPQDPVRVVSQFSHQLTMLHSSRLFAQDKGRLPDAQRAQAIADKEALLHRLERGDERIFRAGVYTAVQAATRDALEERTRRIEAAFGQSRMQTRRALFEPAASLESVLPTGRDALAVTHALDGTTLSTMFPFGAPMLRMEDGVWYGRALQTNTPLIVDPFHKGFTNANGVIIGTSGGGKSVAAKVEILRSLPRGVRVVVIDPGESGEYVRLARAVGGQVVRLSAGSFDRINPLDLPGAGDDAAYDVLGEHIAGVLRLLETLLAGESERLGPGEKGSLEAALFDCYKRAGITRERRTHDRPPPTLPDLYESMHAAPDPFGLAERLARYCTGALSGLFAGQTTVSVNSPLTVFDLRGLDDADLRAAMMHLVAQYVWGVVQRERRPHALYVDEAHLVCKRSASGAFLESLTKRARKHGLRVVPITQDPADFLRTDAGRAILVNSSMAFLFRCEELALQALSEAATLSPSARIYLQSCPPGRGLLLIQHPEAPGERLRIPFEVLVGPAQQPLVFTDPGTDADVLDVAPPDRRVGARQALRGGREEGQSA